MLYVDEVQKALGAGFDVETFNGRIRINTGFNYFDGDCVDVFLKQGYLITEVTDFGEGVRLGKNRHRIYDPSVMHDSVNAIVKILQVDFQDGVVSKVINGTRTDDLKDAVMRVALASSAVSSWV